ncbi:CBS domain-containing protein [Striga asiatica]|uniref:CBS domain-containing protein n=1 Tax=Striga asiatica TaxID=4170 RepID=A0A5A7R6Y9_STRAF|nr:CBS domain-containing protein [Striga asiatica]
MAVKFLNGDILELCLGKPELTCVAESATVSDALAVLRASGDGNVSVWACGGDGGGSCACVGKFCNADAVLFLCREENLADPFKALESQVSDLLPAGPPIVRHLEPSASLMDAIDYILEGAQNLVIPIQNQSPNKFPSQKYCWLTQEDIVRFLLNSVRAFSPVPTFTLDSLNIIDYDIITVPYREPASSALDHFQLTLAEQKSVALVDEENRLIGEISPFALSCLDETAAGAIMALSALELMTYVECSRPPEDLVRLMRVKLRERGFDGMVEFIDEHLNSSSSSCCCSSSSSSSGEFSSDEDCGPRRIGRSCSPGRRLEAVACRPGSSLVAVMIQALTHRVSCVWVVNEDYGVVGAVTLAGILKVLGGKDGRSEDSLGMI